MTIKTKLVLALLATSFGASGQARVPYCVLVVEETAGQLSILAPDGARARVPLGLRPHELAVTRDGRIAYVAMFGIADYNNRLGTPGTSVVEVNLRLGREIRRFALPPGRRAPHGIQLRPGNAQELFTNTEVGGDHMIVFDTRSGKVLRQFPIPQATHNFVFSRTGNSLYGFAGKRGVYRLDAATGRVMSTADIGSPARGVRLYGERQLAVSGKGEVVILDANTLTIVRRLMAPVAGQLAYLETFSNGSIVAPSLTDGGIVVFDPLGKASFVATGSVALVVRRAPDGVVYVSNVLDDHLSVFHVMTGPSTVVKTFEGANGVAFGNCPL